MLRQAEVEIRRLETFFVQLKSQSPDLDEGARNKLEKFFAELRRLLSAEPVIIPAKPVAPSVDANRLQDFIHSLASHGTELYKPNEAMNLWLVAGLGRDEVRNAAVLGWALDWRQSHGYGPQVIDALLALLARRHEGLFPIPVEIAKFYRVAREFYSFGDQQNRVDLIVDSSDAVIVIEVKIDAPERADQVKDYLDIVTARASTLGKANSCVIYLTRGRSRPGIAHPSLVLCSWKDVAAAIRFVIARGTLPKTETLHAMAQLARHFDEL